jgi:hypothetical protein
MYSRTGQKNATGGDPSPPSSAGFAGELIAWFAGGGIITFALFPFSLPLLALLAIAAIPLLIAGLAGALAFAVLAVPVLLVRKLGAVRAPPLREERWQS